MSALAVLAVLASGAAALPASDLEALARLDRDVRCRVLSFDHANAALLRRAGAFIVRVKAGYDRILRTSTAPGTKLRQLQAHRQTVEPVRRNLLTTVAGLDGSPSMWVGEIHEALADLEEAVPSAYVEAARGNRHALRVKAEELDRLLFMVGVWRKEIARADLARMCRPTVAQH